MFIGSGPRLIHSFIFTISKEPKKKIWRIRKSFSFERFRFISSWSECRRKSAFSDSLFPIFVINISQQHLMFDVLNINNNNNNIYNSESNKEEKSVDISNNFCSKEKNSFFRKRIKMKKKRNILSKNGPTHHWKNGPEMWWRWRKKGAIIEQWLAYLLLDPPGLSLNRNSEVFSRIFFSKFAVFIDSTLLIQWLN